MISYHKHSGLSLIELMIAISLGIFITGGMINLFVSSKQSYRLNENMSRLQENTNFAISFIERDIRMTDYRACVTEDRLNNAISGTDNNTAVDTIINGTDTISLSWQPNLCGGVSKTTIYTIQNGSGNAPALFRNIDGNNRELIEGISDLQILYGEDTNDNLTPDYYVAASTAGLNMSQVISVRITLTAQTLDSNLTSSGDFITHNVTTTIALRNRLP